MYRFILAALLLAFSTAASAGELVREFKGTGNTTTASFLVEGPWLLDWRLDTPDWRAGRGTESRFSALDITLIEAKTGRHVGRVKHTKYVGNGLRLFDFGGRYQLRVSTSLAKWTIRIEQLTPEEAKLYTPKE